MLSLFENHPSLIVIPDNMLGVYPNFLKEHNLTINIYSSTSIDVVETINMYLISLLIWEKKIV